jgi:hypothetical protein
MPSRTPFVLVDNVFDRINLYPNATLSWSAAVVGREGNYAADYRRERSFYQAAAAAASNAIVVDLGAGNTAAPDTIWLDRGHNLWGKTIYVEGSTDGAAWNNPGIVVAMVVPAQGTVGGDPTTGWCVTEEGALYTITANVTARRYWRIYVSDVFAPIFTGVVIGTRVQLLGYSGTVDEDAGERFERSEASLIPGYAGDDRTYSARKIDLDLKLIGATEYDGSIRTLRRLLFDRNQPAVVCMNYGVKPERTWLYKYKGGQWSSPTSRTYRSAKISLYEYGPLIR